MIDELYLYSYANEPNKSPWRERLGGPSPPERNGHLSSPSRSCLGSLFLRLWRNLGGCVKAPPTSPQAVKAGLWAVHQVEVNRCLYIGGGDVWLAPGLGGNYLGLEVRLMGGEI